MLGYLRAFSIFFIWAIIALTTHYFISLNYFNNCNLNQSETIVKVENTKPPFIVTDNHNNIIHQSSNGFVIYKGNNKVSNNIENFSYLIDTISDILQKDYRKGLNITGTYLKSEINNSNLNALGIQRAEVVKKEFLKTSFDEARIKTFEKEKTFTFSKENSYSNGIFIKISTLPKTVIDSLELNISNQILYLEFENNQITQKNDLQKKVNIIKQYLINYPSKSITIIGHTDNVGYYDNNLIIGLNRANLVKEYLIKEDINKLRLKTVSKGESEPIADKTSIAGRKINSRIEIKIN